MIAKAMILAKRVEVPHGGAHFEYYLKLSEYNSFMAYYGNPDELPDAPARYRGPIEVRCFWGKLPAVGERVALGPYRLRVIQRDIARDTVICVLDNRLSFVPVWRAKVYWLWWNIYWRLIATGQIWGIMERPTFDDMTVAMPRKRLWEYTYAYQKLLRLASKLHRRAA